MRLLDNLMARRSANAQRGFTMVELAIVLVVAGLILVAALKGTDMVNKAKSERSVSDLRGLQGILLEYQKRTNRLPGDCNNDGKIGYIPPVSLPANHYDATESNRILPDPASSTGVTANCAGSTTVEASVTAQNIVWNDLRRNNIVDAHRLPIELAKNVNGTWFAVGNMAGTGANANVIVVYDIPVWMAEAIDASIDGIVSYTGGAATTASSPANTGRIRRWDKNVTVVANTSATFAATAFDSGFAVTGETRDSLISISYQFDANKLIN